jgi:serine/threonine protein kinase
MSELADNFRRAIVATAPHLEITRLESELDGCWTFAARQLDRDRPVTLRVMRLEKCGLGRTCEQVSRAVLRLRQLDHAGIVRILGGGNSGAFAYLELDVVDGKTLANVLANRRLSDKQRFQLAADVAESLAYLHSQGLRYGNILLDSAVIQRERGGLRYSTKLTRLEGLRGYRADGSEQRTYATFLTALIDAGSDVATSSNQDVMKQIALKCAAATNDAPRLEEIAAQLRAVENHMGSSAARSVLRFAEPNHLQIPTKRTSRKPGSQTSTWNLATSLIVGGVVILAALASVFDRQSIKERDRSKIDVKTLPPVAQARQNEVQDILKQTIPRSRRSSSRPRFEREYSFHPGPFQSDRGTLFEPQTDTNSLPPEAFLLPWTISNPRWEKNNFGHDIIVVDYTGPAARSRSEPVRWIFESDTGRLETTLGPAPLGNGTLRGSFATGLPGSAPFRTYITSWSRLSDTERLSNLQSIENTPPR